MPRFIGLPIAATLGTLVCAANVLHPFLHSAEGGTLDLALDYATQTVLAYLEIN